MTLFKKMFEKVHNNPVSVCFFGGEMKVIEVHGTQNKSPGVPKQLLLTKNLPGKHLFPPPHTTKIILLFVETLETKSWQNLDPKKHSKKLDELFV